MQPCPWVSIMGILNNKKSYLLPTFYRSRKKYAQIYITESRVLLESDLFQFKKMARSTGKMYSTQHFAFGKDPHVLLLAKRSPWISVYFGHKATAVCTKLLR